MREMLAQTDEVLSSASGSGGEDRNKRLEMLACDLSRKNRCVQHVALAPPKTNEVKS